MNKADYPEYLWPANGGPGIHRDCIVEQLLDDEELVEQWSALPAPEREAMMHLALIARKTDNLPRVGLVVDIARQFNADPAIVLAGWGYVPDRTLTPLEASAFLIWRNILTELWAEEAA